MRSCNAAAMRARTASSTRSRAEQAALRPDAIDDRRARCEATASRPQRCAMSVALLAHGDSVPSRGTTISDSPRSSAGFASSPSFSNASSLRRSSSSSGRADAIQCAWRAVSDFTATPSARSRSTSRSMRKPPGAEPPSRRRTCGREDGGRRFDTGRDGPNGKPVIIGRRGDVPVAAGATATGRDRARRADADARPTVRPAARRAARPRPARPARARGRTR